MQARKRIWTPLLVFQHYQRTVKGQFQSAEPKVGFNMARKWDNSVFDNCLDCINKIKLRVEALLSRI